MIRDHVLKMTENSRRFKISVNLPFESFYFFWQIILKLREVINF